MLRNTPTASLAKDPTSRDALLVKVYGGTLESHLDARQRLMELYPDDADTMVIAIWDSALPKST